ncbi:MAG: ribonuclease III [Treponema sp.]|jgi:ribonuclease-3|nr:ribonuclease III [Treponema sp.]
MSEFPALDPGRKKQLAAFQKAAGIRFRSLELLNLSFMHRSLSNESGIRLNNERLEFLGDSILGAACATLLYEKYAEKSEGELAKIKSVVVSEDVLSGVARVLQIDTILLLGRGEELSGGRTKKAILADALEALIGALYLDSGYKAAFDFVKRYFIPEIEHITETDSHRDYKSLLQELCQHFFRSYPEYRMVKRSGPEHERIFWIEVSVDSKVYGPGTGRNKKSAEQEAARMAYQALENKI